MTNRPCSALPIPAPPECERPLPPSLQPCRLRQLRKRPCTLQDLWGQGTAAKRPCRAPAEAPVATPYSWRLTQVPSGLPCDEPARLRWKELVGLSVAREAFPLWRHLWHPPAVPTWVSWLELTVGFVVALGRLPPPFDRRQQRWLGLSDIALRPDVDTSVSAVVTSFRGLLGPLLSSLNWPPAPFRVPGAHPVLRTPLPLVAWRWTPALQTRVHQVLFQWFPAGIQRAVALHAHRPWPCTDAIPPAEESLFPVGIAAPGPPLKKRRR